MWIYLNWALGLRALGCRVLWLEGVQPETQPNELEGLLTSLKARLSCFGFDKAIAISACNAEQAQIGLAENCIDISSIDSADLLINLSYGTCVKSIQSFRRSVLIDIDPGLLQIWMSEGNLVLPPHDCYFTIGENIGRASNRTPSFGIKWLQTHPCVALEWWPVCKSNSMTRFTTLSHWHTSREWVSFGSEVYHNDKRSGFMPFLDLPQRTSQSLELALCLGDDEEEEIQDLTRRGWHLRKASEVASSAESFRSYIQASKGEFSCAKPSYVRMENAWLSDRTVCYLASGKPAVVQFTGPSEFLPEAEGLFRFRDIAEAAAHLDTIDADYENQCRLARALAEKHFDAKKVVADVINQSLDS